MDKIKRKELIKSFNSYAYGPLGSGILGIISLSTLTWIVSPENFGKMSLFIAATTILSIISIAGLNNAFARNFHEQSNKSSLFYNCLLPSIIISTLIIFGILVFHKVIETYIFQQEDYLSIIALSITTILAPPHMLFMLTLELEGKAILSSIILIVWRMIEFLIAVLLLLLWKNSYQSLIIAQFSSFIFTMIWLLALTSKYWKCRPRIDIHFLKELLNFSIPIAFSRTMMIITGYVNLLLINHWCSFAEVGTYEVASKIAFTFVIFRSIIERFWVPTQYLFLSRNENNRSYHEIIDILSSAVLIIFGIIVVFRDLISLFIGLQFSSSLNIFVFLLFSNAIYIFVSIISYGIHFSKKTKPTIGISIISLIINFSLLKYLVPLYGVQGAAITQATTSFVYFIGTLVIVGHLWKSAQSFSMLKDSLIMAALGISTLFSKSYEIAIIILVLCYKFKFALKSSKTLIYLLRERKDIR